MRQFGVAHEMRKVRFEQFSFENDPLDSWQAEKYAIKQEVLSFQEDGQKCKMVLKIEFTPLPD